MKKYNRINDFLADNNGSQQTMNGIDRHDRHQHSVSSASQQRFHQTNQNLQNRIQRRYEADGSEEEEIQRQNHLLSTTMSSQSTPSQSSAAQTMMSSSATAFAPSMQRNMNSGSGEDTGGANSLVSNISNIDANSLYSKLKELQEAEQRLKQVEDLMKSIEKMENNIKEVKRDSVVVHNESRVKTSNEMQTKYTQRNNNNVTKPVVKSVSHSTQTQPKQLPLSSANNISGITHSQKNIITRNISDENTLEMNVLHNTNANTTPHQLLSQSMDFCDNNLGYNTDVDESESNSEESFNLMNGNLIRSMRSQFDSMRSQFETILPVLENQYTTANGNMNSNMNANMNVNHNLNSHQSQQQTNTAISSNYMNNQFFHLMLLQNYQILQQQQMLLLWLQNQQNQCQTPHQQSPPPLPPQPPHPQRHHHNHNHTAHHYMNGRYPAANISSIGQNSVHYPNSTMNSARNNASNVHNMTALNNQVIPGVRANNYWDNFKSYSRQNKLSAHSSANSKCNENLSLTHNQMVSPVMGAVNDHQMHHNTNHSHDMGSKGLVTLSSPNSTLGRQHAYKTANASHVQCVEHVEKQQNLPQFNGDSNASIAHKSQHNSDSNNFAALFSILEKLIESDDKFATKASAAKKKSTNLVMTASDNDDECVGGAVGGVGVAGVANVNSNQTQTDETDGSNKSVQQTSGVASGRSPLTSASNIAIPLHIPASSGAIRKKPRNQEILELSSKADNSDNFGHPLVTGSELIRPLMAAEGRSSETSVSNTTVPPKTPILSTRPPTTGWPYECDSDSNASSDDQLAEADQTASELVVSEAEAIIHTNNSANNCNISGNSLNTNNNQSVNPVSAQTLDTTQRSSTTDDINSVVTNDTAVEEEDEDNILANDLNESSIRLSGDGEQGL